MKEREKIDELERLLKELKAGEAETAVTVEEVEKRPPGFGRVGKVLFSWRRKTFLLVALLMLIAIAIPFTAFYFLTSGSTFKEENIIFLERIQDLNELATAEAYTKVTIEEEDNKLFGQDIGVNLPGTKRQVFVLIPGSIKAGIELSNLTEKDIKVDHEKKTATLILPPAKFLGGAEITFDNAVVFSSEGLFRAPANIEKGYELAEKAKKLIEEETEVQGILQTAERNAEKTLREMFSFAGYDVTIEFKE